MAGLVVVDEHLGQDHHAEKNIEPVGAVRFVTDGLVCNAWRTASAKARSTSALVATSATARPIDSGVGSATNRLRPSASRTADGIVCSSFWTSSTFARRRETIGTVSGSKGGIVASNVCLTLELQTSNFELIAVGFTVVFMVRIRPFRTAVLALGLGALACGGPGARLDMNQIADRYVRLVLKVGQHDENFVDAYYGDSAWKPRARRRRWRIFRGKRTRWSRN